MPQYDFRIEYGSVELRMMHRRLCDPTKGQSIKFKHGPIEYWLKVTAIEPQPGAPTVVRLASQGHSLEYLKSADWKEVSE